MGHLVVETAIVITSILNYLHSAEAPADTLLSDKCSSVIEIPEAQARGMNYVYMILGDSSDKMNFKLIVSSLVVQYTLIIIIMLQRTQKLGELIMMVGHMM